MPSRDIDQALTQAEERLERLRRNDAAEIVSQVLDTAADEEVQLLQDRLRAIIVQFYPKNRKRLQAHLADRLAGVRQHPSSDGSRVLIATIPETSRIDVSAFASEFHAVLADLRDHKIFQWSTYYRDSFSEMFERVTAPGLAWDDVAACCEALKAEVRAHAAEVFSKGFSFVRGNRVGAKELARSKSLAGLRSFLELPLELYSGYLLGSIDAKKFRAARYVASGVVRGVLEGYCDVDFEESDGVPWLRSSLRVWGHSLPFLVADDLSAILDRLGDYPALERMRPALTMLSRCLDIAAGEQVMAPLALSVVQLNLDLRRIDIALKAPMDLEDVRPIEIAILLDDGSVARQQAVDARRRAVVAILCSIDDEMRAAIQADAVLAEAVVDIGDKASVEQRLLDVLEFAVSERRHHQVGTGPLRFNLARQFPLQNPKLLTFFRVARPSIRALFSTLELRNGMRLWCSVRRSGKTTACFELQGPIGKSMIVTQTCDSTHPVQDASLLHDQVVDALRGGRYLSKDFVESTVRQCAGLGVTSEQRFVLILDEYERLFGRIQYAVRRDPELRYLVAEPLFDQLVAFSRDNLFVMLGQQPNAHFILMDQNQLSAYVQQDPFPLFQHQTGSRRSEFTELLRKALTDRIRIETSFADAVYEETTGHPFLTINLLVEFVDWLIERSYRPADAGLSRGDFEEFAQSRLQARSVASSREYEFFRNAAGEALGPHGKSGTPWLHAAYAVLQWIARESPSSLTISREQFGDFAQDLTGGAGLLSTENLLVTASQANFLAFNEHAVWPRIPLLARICRDVHPGFVE